jgi:MbtH protein
MSDNETGPDRFQVVVNDEEQYSIWPEDRTVPPGWRADGVVGTKEHCLDHIEEVWTDMRPLSLRTRMADRESSVAG